MLDVSHPVVFGEFLDVRVCENFDGESSMSELSLEIFEVVFQVVFYTWRYLLVGVLYGEITSVHMIWGSYVWE